MGGTIAHHGLQPSLLAKARMAAPAAARSACPCVSANNQPLSFWMFQHMLGLVADDALFRRPPILI